MASEGVYAGILCTADTVLNEFDTRIPQGGATLGPQPPDLWSFKELRMVKPPVAGTYLLHVSFQFDTSVLGLYEWKFQYELQYFYTQHYEVEEYITNGYADTPPSIFTRTLSIHLGPGPFYYPAVFYDGTERKQARILPGSWWQLTLCSADSANPPPPLGAWCEPFIPQNADDADNLYTAHLERMNDLSIAF